MQSVSFAKSLVVTPELRNKYSIRLRVLHQKYQAHNQAIKDMAEEKESIAGMCYLPDIGRILEPEITAKEQNRIYQCIRKAAARGQIRSTIIEHVRRCIYVHIEDARFYWSLTTGQKREMGLRDYSLDEMRKRVQE